MTYEKSILLHLRDVACHSGLLTGRNGRRLQKHPTPPPVQESLYRDHEFQLDLFGAYAPSGPNAGRYLGDHAWGGGAEFNYFFKRYFGLGLGGDVLSGTGRRSGDVSGDFALNAFLRYPIGTTAFAPYLYSGISGFVPGTGSNIFRFGYNTSRDRNSDDVLLEGHVGLGVEYRVTKSIGLFSDGRYEFVENKRDDFGLVRAGVRFAF